MTKIGESLINMKTSQEYKIIDILVNDLNVGEFSTIVKVQKNKTNEIYAAKIPFYKTKRKAKKDLEINNNINPTKKTNVIKTFENENTIYKKIESIIHNSQKDSKIGSEYICKYYETFTDAKKGDNIIILEYVENGNLEYLNKTKILKDIEIKNYAAQILLGIYFLHNNNIIHCDLKPSNILITKNNKIRICDFGFSIDCSPKYKTEYPNGRTLLYSPPEMIYINNKDKTLNNDDRLQSYKIDIWSFGVIIYYLYTKSFPFEDYNDSEEFKDIIKNGKIQLNDSNIPNDAKKFIKKILIKEKVKRPTAFALLNDSYFDEVNIDELSKSENYVA